MAEETAESAAMEVEAEHAAMLARVAFVRRVVATGVNIQGASDAANQVAEDGYKALLAYIDWLETAIAVGRSQWRSKNPTPSEIGWRQRQGGSE